MAVKTPWDGCLDELVSGDDKKNSFGVLPMTSVDFERRKPEKSEAKKAGNSTFDMRQIFDMRWTTLKPNFGSNSDRKYRF